MRRTSYKQCTKKKKKSKSKNNVKFKNNDNKGYLIFFMLFQKS